MVSVSASVRLDPQLVQYAVGLVQATRASGDVRLGASPRGSLGLLRAAQSLAAAEGRTYAIADDVKRLAVPVLAHRLLVAPDAQLRGVSADRVINDLLATVGVPGGVGHPMTAVGPTRPARACAPDPDRHRRASSARIVLLVGGIVLGLSPLVGPRRRRPRRRPDRARLRGRAAPHRGRPRSRTPPEVERGSPADGDPRVPAPPAAGPAPSPPSRPSPVSAAPTSLPAIAAGHVVPLTYEVETTRRGNLVAGPMMLRRVDPFGLVTAERRLGGTCTVSVRPRRHPLQHAALRPVPRPRGADPRGVEGHGVVPPAPRVRARRRHAPHPLADHRPAPGRSWSSSSSTPPGPRWW